MYQNVFLSNEIAVLAKAVEGDCYVHALDFLHRDSHQGRETFEVFNFGLAQPGMVSHIQACLDVQCIPLVVLVVWPDSK